MELVLVAVVSAAAATVPQLLSLWSEWNARKREDKRRDEELAAARRATLRDALVECSTAMSNTQFLVAGQDNNDDDERPVDTAELSAALTRLLTLAPDNATVEFAKSALQQVDILANFRVTPHFEQMRESMLALDWVGAPNTPN